MAYNGEPLEACAENRLVDCAKRSPLTGGHHSAIEEQYFYRNHPSKRFFCAFPDARFGASAEAFTAGDSTTLSAPASEAGRARRFWREPIRMFPSRRRSFNAWITSHCFSIC